MGGLVGKREQLSYLRFAVLWFLLLLGSSWLGWGEGSGGLKKNTQMLGSIPNTSAGPGGFIAPNVSESVPFSPSHVPPTILLGISQLNSSLLSEPPVLPSLIHRDFHCQTLSWLLSH